MTKTNRQAGFLRTIWVYIFSALRTFYTCVRILTLRGSERPDFRQRIDTILRRWANSLMRVVDVRMTVYGEENLKFKPGRAYILLCSHCSNYDILATWTVVPASVRMLAKKELSKVPVFGQAMVRAEFPFVERGNHQRALNDLKVAQEKLESGIILWLAPEGTRSRNGKLGRLKKGGFHLAFNTDAIVIPIGYRNIFEVQPAKTFRWTLHQPVECHIGAPIDTRNFNKRDTDQLRVMVGEQLRMLVGENGEGKVTEMV